MTHSNPARERGERNAEPLGPRRRAILRGIVVEFVDTAEPVGSRNLQRDLGLKESPATIRNEMAALEKQGLIFQPFTSAGRVPTDSGFRTFVDDLLDASALSRELERDLRDAAKQATAQDDAHVRAERLAKMLAELTDDLAFVVHPERRNAAVAGFHSLVREPEARSDASWTSELLRLLEDEDAFLSQVLEAERGAPDGSVRFVIGGENSAVPLQRCTMAFSGTVDPRTHEPTIVGFIGPTRMDYERTAALLRTLADLFDQ